MNSFALSKTVISTFAGDVVTLRIRSDRDFSRENVNWTVDDPALARIREFSGTAEDCFSDGVLLVLLKEGATTVRAETGGHTACCALEIRAPRKADPNGEWKHYFGDFHAHTSHIHNPEGFHSRIGEDPAHAYGQVREEGLMSCFTVSDHAYVVNRKEFFRVFLDAEANATPDFIPFPGVECEVDIDWEDDYGLPNRSSGEIVTFNAQGWAGVHSWEEYFERVRPHPYAIGSLAHPQILGYSLYAIWNFDLFHKTTPELLDLIRMVEMGNGGDCKSNLINERVYSIALDCGFTIAPTCSSDSHGPVWGADSLPGRTVVLAPGRSKELFLDALRHARVYATESGNVKLSYTVNGYQPGNTLPPAGAYEWIIHAEPFHAPAVPLRFVEIVSDYGEVVASQELNGASADLTMCVQSSTARYFYLRIFDEDGARTWSAPVWTGRATDPCPLPPFRGKRMDKSAWTITSPSGANAELAICGDPRRPWTADGNHAELTIDMGTVARICGFGYYPHAVDRDHDELLARFINRYEVSVSMDGVTYQSVARGIMRAYGGEQIVRIEPVMARFVRLNAPDTVGAASRRPRYINEPIMIGELDVYKATRC